MKIRFRYSFIAFYFFLTLTAAREINAAIFFLTFYFFLKPPDQLAVAILLLHLRVTPAGYTQIPAEALTVLATEGRGGLPLLLRLSIWNGLGI